jgi:hypothetical protein
MKSSREWGDFDFSDEEMLGRLRDRGRKLEAGEALRTFYEAYAERQGKPRWGEKTPRYVGKMRQIQGALPEARFVHVVRDGRDVALSVLDRTVRDLTAADVAKRCSTGTTRSSPITSAPPTGSRKCSGPFPRTTVPPSSTSTGAWRRTR